MGHSTAKQSLCFHIGLPFFGSVRYLINILQYEVGFPDGFVPSYKGMQQRYFHAVVMGPLSILDSGGHTTGYIILIIEVTSYPVGAGQQQVHLVGKYIFAAIGRIGHDKTSGDTPAIHIGYGIIAPASVYGKRCPLLRRHLLVFRGILFYNLSSCQP